MKQQVDQKRPKQTKSVNLKVLFPCIAMEWDYENNGTLTPEMVSPSFSKGVNWVCSRGHRWRTTVEARTRNHTRCPYCTGKRPVPGETDLESLFPDLAKEWDYTENGSKLPSQYRPMSNAKVNWVCPKGHKWPARIADRVSGTGCPYCNGKIPIVGENNLATLYPHVAKEWHFEKNKDLLPSQVSPGSDKKVWWKCSKGHEWKAIIGNRTRHGSKCPYCAGKRPIVGENDLWTTHPFLLDEWNYEKNGSLTPRDVMAGTKKKIWWTCRDGHTWKASIASRALRNSKCPYCSGLLPIKGGTDMATQNPYLASQWDYNKNKLTPDEVSYYSNKKVWWICPEGHSWRASIDNREKNPTCPRCNQRRRK